MGLKHIEHGHCQGCNVREHLNLLDAKSSTDENGDFDRLYCVACYGPGWCPTGGSEDFALSIVPRLWWRYRLWQFRDWLSDLRWRLSRRFA